MQTEVFSGFSTLEVEMYDDRIKATNKKKGKTNVYPFDEMVSIVAKKDNITITMQNKNVEVFVFNTKAECATWEEMIQKKL